MSAKSGKGTQRKAAKGAAEPSVLGSLPATRPTRMSRRREGGAATAEPPKPAAANGAAKKPAAANGAAKRAATKPSAARTTSPARKPATSARKAAATRPSRPEAVSAGSPRLRTTTPSEGQPPRSEPPRRSGPPTGVELATTVVQAAGEVAQIGATVGKQILKRTLSRIPRP